MRLIQILAVVTLWAVLSLARQHDIVITTRRNAYYGDTYLIDIHFSLHEFKEFYECLCKATTQQCSVQIQFDWSSWHPTTTSSDELQEYSSDDPTCKYYQCYYTTFSSIFVCTQVQSASCQISPKTQSIYYNDANCGSTKCVTIAWTDDNENLDYSVVSNTVKLCKHNCECSTGVPPTATAVVPTATVLPAAIVYTIPNTNMGQLRKTSSTTISTTKTTKPQKPTTANPVTVSPTEAITSQIENTTTETNATRSDFVSDSQPQNNTVPIIVGVIVAVILVAGVAAVAAFLWKRKRERIQKSSTDVHEYANLPGASLRAKESDTRTSLGNLNQEQPGQRVNYDRINGSYEYDHNEATIYNRVNPTNDSNAVLVPAVEQRYVNCSPSKHTAAHTYSNQAMDTHSNPNGDYVAIANTVEETDDCTRSIYTLAKDNHNNDPKHADGNSSSLAETNVNNCHSQKATNEPYTNATNAIATTRAYPNNGSNVVNDYGYSMANTDTNAEPTVNSQNLDKAKNPHQDYDYATQTNMSINDSCYSVSNSDLNPDTTYSMAANPVNTNTAPASSPHVYTKLGKELHHLVNPYDALEQANEIPIPKQANPKLHNHDKFSERSSPYSLAQPNLKSPQQNDSVYSYQITDSQAADGQHDGNTYASVDDSTPQTVYSDNQLNNPSRHEQSNKNIYFELESD